MHCFAGGGPTDATVVDHDEVCREPLRDLAGGLTHARLDAPVSETKKLPMGREDPYPHVAAGELGEPRELSDLDQSPPGREAGDGRQSDDDHDQITHAEIIPGGVGRRQEINSMAAV